MDNNNIEVLQTTDQLNAQPVDTPKKTERSSNLELYRIITMILIVAHHYVVNSGLMQTAIPGAPLSFKSIFLLLFGAWGKTGINCFVLITGYFMCKSKITLSKFLKLFLEFYFYRILLYVIFWVTGYYEFGLKELIIALIPFRKVATGFVGNFLFFYLFIPFLNILVNNMKEKQHLLLIVLSCALYVFFGTVPFFSIQINYVSWFMILYLISSYIRMYPKAWYSKTKLWLVLSLISIALSAISVVACAIMVSKGYLSSFYFFVEDSNTLLALTNGIFTFMLFKNLKIKTNKFINTVASTMFGVLLLHAHSDTMRAFLWQDVFNNVGAYYEAWMPLHAIGTVLAVFIICVAIDLLRIKFVEKPFFAFFKKKEEGIVRRYKKIENKICDKLDVKD